MGYPYQDGPTWPTIDHNEKELKIDRDAVKKIIDDLKNNDLNKFVTQHGKAGLPDDLQSKVSAIQVQEIGGGGDPKSGFPAGQKVWQVIQRVNDGQNGFPALYRNFVSAYANVISALYVNAGIIDQAEQDSEVQGTGDQNAPTTTSATGNQGQT